ncbi:hypothetical protein SDC9_190267 [bioreactor metagenome]|uniref:Uncharacterized protein n=1 Tax=bioreactor metagenome TaxID=1076179 RepID=A0A645HV34_9ZZZZ
MSRAACKSSLIKNGRPNERDSIRAFAPALPAWTSQASMKWPILETKPGVCMLMPGSCLASAWNRCLLASERLPTTTTCQASLFLINCLTKAVDPIPSPPRFRRRVKQSSRPRSFLASDFESFSICWMEGCSGKGESRTCSSVYPWESRFFTPSSVGMNKRSILLQ